MMKISRSPVFGKASLIASALFAAAGVARAWVVGGPAWWGDVITPNGCVGMYLETGTQWSNNKLWSYGTVWSRQCTNINPQTVALPASWIGTAVGAYRNGGFCGSRGYQFTPTTASNMTMIENICSNPSGTQTFQSYTNGKIWNGNGYTMYGSQWSPALNQ